MCRTFVKIMRRFCYRCFKGWFSTRVKIWKIRDLMRIVLAIAEWGINGTKCKWNLRNRDSLEGSAHTPVYNPHIHLLKQMCEKLLNFIESFNRGLVSLYSRINKVCIEIGISNSFLFKKVLEVKRLLILLFSTTHWMCVRV